MEELDPKKYIEDNFPKLAKDLAKGEWAFTIYPLMKLFAKEYMGSQQLKEREPITPEMLIRDGFKRTHTYPGMHNDYKRGDTHITHWLCLPYIGFELVGQGKVGMCNVCFMDELPNKI